MTSELRILVTGAPSGHMLLRVVNLLVQRGLPLREINACVEGDQMRIEVVATAPFTGYGHLVDRLRSLVEVSSCDAV